MSSPEPSLFDRYLSLEPQDRILVEILAVNFEALPVRPLKSALMLRPSEKIDFSRLIDQGLIIKTRVSKGSEGYGCPAVLRDQVMREVSSDPDGFAALIDMAREAWPLESAWGATTRTDLGAFQFVSPAQFIREIRLGLYLGDELYIEKVFAAYRKYAHQYWRNEWQDIPSPDTICLNAILNPFSPSWFQTLPSNLQKRWLPGLFHRLLSKPVFDQRLWYSLMQRASGYGLYPVTTVLGLLLLGNHEEVGSARSQLIAGEGETTALSGVMALLLGETDLALSMFEEGIRRYRREAGDKKALLPGLLGVFHAFSLLVRGDPKDLTRLKGLIGQSSQWQRLYPVYKLLGWALEMESNPTRDHTRTVASILDLLRRGEMAEDLWTTWLGSILLFRFASDSRVLEPLVELFLKAHERCRSQGLLWPSAEFAFLGARLTGDTGLKEFFENFENSSGWQLLARKMPFEAPWERMLRTIGAKFAAPSKTLPPGPDGEKESSMRLAWMIERDYGTFRVEAREQKRTARGWGKGKPVSLKNLQETAEIRPYLLPEDRAVIGHIVHDTAWRVHRLSEMGWRALQGHPLVFDKVTELPLEITFSMPSLRIERIEDGRVRIRFWPEIYWDQDLVFQQDRPGHLEIIPLKSEHHRLRDMMGEGFDAPESAHDQLIQGLKSVTSLVTIQSELGTESLDGTANVQPHSATTVQLFPEGEGLRIALLVRPLGPEGPAFVPGLGPRTLVGERGGGKVQTLRSPEEEIERARTLLSLCPTLESADHTDNAFEWVLGDTETGLELLLEIQRLEGGLVDIEWPRGKAFEVIGEGSSKQFEMRVMQQRDWFQVSGELKVDDGEVLLMQTLLQLTETPRGRFIRLEGDRFLALTASFRKRLDDLRAFTERHGNNRRIHPLALPLIQGMGSEFGDFETDEAFRARIHAQEQVQFLTPEVPGTLRTDLRDYQIEGYRWLSHLAALGVGGCLADDMGLGKTLQAIAMLLSRAPRGPALVIAPTSVVFNWQREMERFAPTLSPLELRGDRRAIVDQLGAYDVLVVSYGLIQQESVIELLAERSFSTVILDEAQAIKNAGTRRSKAVMRLQGDFRLLLTGTPLENHLGELWNLFRFINPGLLGSEESFNQRFAFPIERDGNREVRHRLKQLIRPFLLRRTKSEVLTELPERTEIELKVVLAPREAAFYEALRRELLDNLTAPGTREGDHRLRILAAITKLRRACCNPSLVAPDLGIPSSKLALLETVLDELLENRHKALIFSQFVDHLSLVRAMLDRKGIVYQYLDGQTPASDRKHRVESFQGGDGDVFLISLKAGGSGLNLTAADFVIHLDPWWNPAVEDQASSRAHRMGQERPVTVYRLVAQGTIEEEITALHTSKRELAEGLLAEGELAGRMDAEALLDLMRSGLSAEE